MKHNLRECWCGIDHSREMIPLELLTWDPKAGRYHVEASDLQFWPGQWPEEIKVKISETTNWTFERMGTRTSGFPDYDVLGTEYAAATNHGRQFLFVIND